MSEDIKIELESFFENSRGLLQFMTMYNCAIKEVRTKFEIINDNFTFSTDL